MELTLPQLLTSIADAVGDRLKEAASINKSLLCLGHVINTLVDMESGRKRHIPFRDSKVSLEEAIFMNERQSNDFVPQLLHL